MRRYSTTVIFVALVLIGSRLALTAEATSEADSVLIQWDFQHDGDFQGWAPNGHNAEPAVTAGTLRGRVIGSDPILTGPTFEIPARPAQRVEIRMKTAGTTPAELFWTETLEGQYGGFSHTKCNTFHTTADGQFHVYRIYPFWQAAGRVLRLRFDPPGDGPFEIDWIRIVDAPASPPCTTQSWTFNTASQGWWSLQELSEPAVRDGALAFVAQGITPILGSPMLAVPTQDAVVVSLRMAVSRGQFGRVYFSTDQQLGWNSVAFPLRADGQPHTYNVELLPLASRSESLVFLGLGPTDAAEATVRIESIALGDQLAGPAELALDYFGPQEGVNRLERPATVVCLVRNRGGELAQGAAVTLAVPEGVKIVGDARQRIAPVAHDFPESLRWSIESSRVGQIPLTVTIELPDSAPVTARAEIEFTRTPDVAKTGSVPEPRPVSSKLDIGTYYFPGWPTMAQWRPILDFPGRKPVLGWYDEANPECIDWQIKWATEHGIKFFLVDWYWCQGRRSLEHWVQSFEKAKHRKYLQWCVMWANHNGPGTHSREDWRQVTQYWIDHCFNLPEYYRIDGQPAVFIWAPYNIRNDLGGPEQAAELYAMSQRMAREAGYPGIYFAAMGEPIPSAASCRELKRQGYEAFTSYHTFQLAEQRAKVRRFPYADVVQTSPEVWQRADSVATELEYFPVLDSGWSSEPWHGDQSLSISGRTPELMGELCRQGRRYAAEHQKKILLLGPVNEWGEGSYFEPCTEYGFGCLDQIRAAFCEAGDYPPNLIPADVGLGPYDLPREAPKTVWEFREEGQLQGWTANSSIQVTVRENAFQGKTTDNDPILYSPRLKVPAHTLRHLTVRLKCSANDRAQVFWTTRLSPAREANSVRFDVIGDGQFHDYELDLGAHPHWRGTVTSLRLDPAVGAGRQLAIERIALH